MTPLGYPASAQTLLSSLAPPRSLARGIPAPSLVLALAIATIGCGSESSTSTGPTPVKCQVSLEAPSNSIEPAGGKDAITVSAQPECSWTASSSATWITGLTPSSGQGSGRVEFQAAANPAATMRQGDIAVNDQKIPVQQRPAPCRFEVSPVTPTVGADGGTVTIAVSAPTGCGWQASVDAGWVAVTSTSGTGSGSVRLRVDSNTGTTRSAALLVAGVTVTLTQESSSGPSSPNPNPNPTPNPNCVFSLDRANAAVGAAGGSLTVAVSGTAGCSRTATSEAPWITVVAGATGTGSGAVTFNVASNSGAARTGTLTIAGRAFTVTQGGTGAPSCSYSVAPNNQSVAAAGGAGAAIQVSTSSGCPWMAASQAASWITLTSPASGSGPGTVTFNVAANSGGARTGTLAVAGDTVTINQAGAAAPSCTFSIGSSNQSIGADGRDRVSVDVSTAAGCAWQATSNAGWITVVSGAIGNGAGAVTFSVAANTGTARTGTLTIAGQTFTVTQANGCTYSINPTGQEIDEQGGPVTVAVSAGAGCGWTATSNDEWITITQGATGSGNGTVRFNVASTNGRKRTGTLTIAGQTFKVDQDKKNERDQTGL